MTTPFTSTSTPKLTSTPSKPSPLPTFSHKSIKSPAIKTPATNHSQKLSISSHPTTHLTPHLGDDILNMSTPAAMLAMGTTSLSMSGLGITPLPTEMMLYDPQHERYEQPQSATNPQNERHERLKTISRNLKARARGRGVSRINVQTLARVHGFEPLWQDDVLTLAGQLFVEMEIEFHGEEVVKASLTLNEGEDANVQEEAGVVLMRDLAVRGSKTVWHDLRGFQDSLTYLSHMEGVGEKAFQIIEEFHGMLERVWKEEKRVSWRGEGQQVCESNLGRPGKDEERLGVSCEFWCDGITFLSGADEGDQKGGKEIEKRKWMARFSLGKGHGLQIPEKQDWLGEEVLTSSARAEDIFHESVVDRPAWIDGDRSKMLDIHFVAEIEPAILVSYPGVHFLNKNGQMTTQETLQVKTFQSLGCEKESWRKTCFVPKERSYRYDLNPGQGLWGFEVKKLVFGHPRQFAEALPVLRQYALIGTLLRSMKPNDEDSETAESSAKTNGTREERQMKVKGTETKFKVNGKVHTSLSERPRIYHRSNRPKVEDEIDSLINDDEDNSSIPISLTLDTHSSPIAAARLNVKIPLSTKLVSTEVYTKIKARDFCSVSIDVLLNGTVEVSGFQGIKLDKEHDEELRKRLAKVVRASEDISMIVSWFLTELSQLPV